MIKVKLKRPPEGLYTFEGPTFEKLVSCYSIKTTIGEFVILKVVKDLVTVV